MKVFISEEHRQNARRTALINIANFFNIPEWDIKTNDELYDEITSLIDGSAVNIIRLLTEYFKAYDDWFNFYQEIKKTEQQENKERVLKDLEQIELSGLVEKRENALKALQEEFDQLQLDRFNRKHFGNDINGIIKND